MGKSVYSMVLNDEVVALIDKKAVLSGLSRSQMINEILADAVGFSTEKQQIADVLERINALEIGRLKVVRRQIYLSYGRLRIGVNDADLICLVNAAYC